MIIGEGEGTLARDGKFWGRGKGRVASIILVISPDALVRCSRPWDTMSVRSRREGSPLPAKFEAGSPGPVRPEVSELAALAEAPGAGFALRVPGRAGGHGAGKVGDDEGRYSAWAVAVESRAGSPDTLEQLRKGR
jgi:hypothetical protein